MRALVVGIAMLLALTQSAAADEVGRVRAHLLAAKARLATRDLAQLSLAQREQRVKAIGNLDRYIERGVFPRRTEDAYEGLRPRFIDDRGVHCAVGQLIADSGNEELARAINAQYEYAYVKDMQSPALVAWADAHGFTVEELAIIQPAYSKQPDEPERGKSFSKELQLGLMGNTDAVLACVGDQPPPERVRVHVVGIAHVALKITTSDENEFARCFAAQAQLVRYRDVPKDFEADLDVLILRPQKLLEQELWHHEFRTPPSYVRDCAPGTGPIVERVTIDIASADHGLAIRVATRPDNALVNECIAANLRSRLGKFHHQIKFHTDLPIEPRVTTYSVEGVLVKYASEYATACSVPGTPSKLRLSVTARREDKGFTVTIPGASRVFLGCMNKQLQQTLRDTHRFKPFLIDSDVNAAFTFELETPEARDRRLAKRRAEAQRARRELDRAGYDDL